MAQSAKLHIFKRWQGSETLWGTGKTFSAAPQARTESITWHPLTMTQSYCQL